jgi:hypothetical protein
VRRKKDSGHEVRRFGEETLFMALRDHNVDAIKASGAKRIVTADPHAFNALKHDYKDMPPVEHISQGDRQRSEVRARSRSMQWKMSMTSTPTTIPVTWGGTTRFMTTREMCSMPFPA